MRMYISDLHFYHEDLNTKMDKRGFENAAAMNEYMIEAWNSKVKKKDEVVIFGDLSVGNAQQTNEIIHRLNGILYLVTGNHDHYVHNKDFDRDRFVWIKPYTKVRDNGRRVVLSHYPILCYDGQYRRNKSGEPYTYMLYGHVHDTADEYMVREAVRLCRNTTRTLGPENEIVNVPCNLINCFCMYSDYQPLTLDEWIELRKSQLNT